MFGHGDGHLLHAICAYDMNIVSLVDLVDLADLVVVCRCGCWLLLWWHRRLQPGRYTIGSLGVKGPVGFCEENLSH